MHFLDLMEPEETVGNLWHEIASGLTEEVAFPAAGASLADLRSSLAVLFRALGGGADVELGEAPATVVRHRRSVRRKLGSSREQEWVATFDGERLRLPPIIASFPERELNRAVYFWLTAVAAVCDRKVFDDLGDSVADPLGEDMQQISANAVACDLAYRACPGLRQAYENMAAMALKQRAALSLSESEAVVERLIRDQLGKGGGAEIGFSVTARGHLPFTPVPMWLRFGRRGTGRGAAEEQAALSSPPQSGMLTSRKLGERRDQEQANRKDSFIIHRFESILSWVESMNINRSVDDNDDENAQKAADDHDRITLSKHDRRAATRLRLHLDLSPSDADHEKLSGEYVYPEWNHRSRAYMDGHCRVLDAPVAITGDQNFHVDQRYVRSVRRQFEALRPRRMIQPRQVDGSELDLDALICARTDLLATGRGSDRIWLDARQAQRDLSVVFLIDTSRSTEAAIGDTSVIDVARQAITALAAGIDAAGDRLAIWGFSSLRRDRVFLTRVKDFEMEMGSSVNAGIASLKPGHYTRLGAAIRHVSAQLAKQTSARKLLVVLTDGKPNDLDHYEGQHGIEDSHMAVREARRAGLSLHGVVIDEDGQDWFARIFGRGGFTLLPHPDRLLRALPEIYRTLTKEN